MEDIFQHYSELIDKMLEENEIFKSYFLEPQSLPSDYKITSNAHITCGVTRGCIVDNNFPFVVKFDLYDYHNDDFFVSCEEEMKYYRLAKRCGFDKYLAEPVKIGTYRNTVAIKKMYTYIESFENDDENEFEEYDEEEEFEIAISLYAYPRAEIKDFWKESTSSNSNIIKHSPLAERNQAIAETFIELYGEEEFVEFSNFLECCKINDLHGYNCAYIDDRFVLIDYAGFYEHN